MKSWHSYTKKYARALRCFSLSSLYRHSNYNKYQLFIILWIPYLFINEGNFCLVKRLTFISKSDNFIDCIFEPWWLINEVKELEIHKSESIQLQWVPLNESPQQIILELQLKLMNDTIKVQYQLLDIIHFITIFST